MQSGVLAGADDPRVRPSSDRDKSSGSKYTVIALDRSEAVDAAAKMQLSAQGYDYFHRLSLPAEFCDARFLEAFKRGMNATSQEQRQFLSQMFLLRGGDLSVRGAVVDDQGTPLDGVEVHVARFLTIATMTDRRTPKSSVPAVVLPRTFELQVTGGMGWALRFTKLGYTSWTHPVISESEQCPLNFVNTDDAKAFRERRLGCAKFELEKQRQFELYIQGKPVQWPQRTLQDVRVVLRKKSSLEPQDVHNLILETGADGASKAFVLVPNEDQQRELELPATARLEQSGILTFEVERDAGKAIIVQNRKPSEVRLSLSGKKSGFSVFRPSVAAENVAPFFQMHTAPADGYSPTLVLNPKTAKGTAFFFHGHGVYGKGVVAGVPDASPLRATIVLQLALNASGSRNLESPEPEPDF